MNSKVRHSKLFGHVLLVIAIAILGACKAMETTPLSEKWKELFSEKPSVITEYSEHHIIHLENTEMVHQDLSYSHIYNAKFDNLKYDDDIFQDGSYTNTEFSGGELNDTSFAGSVLTNVTFRNMTMTKAVFVGATLNNVIFNNCKIYHSELHNLKPSTFTIEDSELNKVNFFQSAMDLTLKNSRIIEEGDFSGLVAGSKVTLDHSYIGPYSDFTFQKGLASFTAKNSELRRFALAGKIHNITLDSCKLDFSIGFSTIDTVTVNNSEMPRLAAGHGSIKSISISDCKESELVDLREATVGSLNIRNCNIGKTVLMSSNIADTHITNSSFDTFDAEHTNLRELNLQNVTINSQGDFKGAIADKAVLTNITIAPTATLNMAGSNIPLKR